MGDLAVEILTEKGHFLLAILASRDIKLKFFYSMTLFDKLPRLKDYPTPQDALLLRCVGAVGALQDRPIQDAEWAQAVATLPQSAENTVTFILKPPTSALTVGPGVSGGGVGSESVLCKRPHSALSASSIAMSDLSERRWIAAETIMGLKGELLRDGGFVLTNPKPFKKSTQKQIWTSSKTVIETTRIAQCLEELRRLWEYVSGKATTVYDDAAAATAGSSLPCVFPSNVVLTVPLLGGQHLSGFGDAYVCHDHIHTNAPYNSILTVDFKTPEELAGRKWVHQGSALAAAHWIKVGRAAVWYTDMVQPGVLYLTETKSCMHLKLQPPTFEDMVELLILLARGVLHKKYKDLFKKHPKKQPLPSITEGDEDHSSPPGSPGRGGGRPRRGHRAGAGHAEGRGARSSGRGTRTVGKRHARTWKKYGDMYVREDGDSEDILFIGDETVKEQLQSLHGMYSSRREENRAVADILNALVVAH